MIEVVIKTELNPTEEPEKILAVINNFTTVKEDDIKIEKISQDYYIYSVTVYGLSTIQSMFDGLRSQRIVESARKFLMRKKKEDGVSFMLNKQALLMRKFHFCDFPDESPMGPVWIHIKSDNITRLLEYLVPHTIKGQPQEVDYLPE